MFKEEPLRTSAEIPHLVPLNVKVHASVYSDYTVVRITMSDGQSVCAHHMLHVC